VYKTLFAAMLALTLPTVGVHAPKAELTLEVARTAAQREHGLMNRTELAPRTGMIFVFERDEFVSFWMKNTLLPLDMIFIGADGKVRRVYANVPVLHPQPSDAQIPLEGAQAKYVIELGAGEAAKVGIVDGIKLDLRGVPSPSP